MIEPVIDELAGRARAAKMNIAENPATAARFNVRSISTLPALKAGQGVVSIVGAQPKAKMARRLERVMT